jgi:hypothetical protein
MQTSIQYLEMDAQERSVDNEPSQRGEEHSTRRFDFSRLFFLAQTLLEKPGHRWPLERPWDSNVRFRIFESIFKNSC